MKRYICTDSGSTYESYGEPKMEECVDGDYVKFEEYEKLKAQLEKAEAVISFYGDENSWYLYKDPETGAEVRRSIEFFDTESFGFQDTPESRNILKVFGGKRAREYFKEKEQV